MASFGYHDRRLRQGRDRPFVPPALYHVSALDWVCDARRRPARQAARTDTTEAEALRLYDVEVAELLEGMVATGHLSADVAAPYIRFLRGGGDA